MITRKSIAAITIICILSACLTLARPNAVQPAAQQPVLGVVSTSAEDDRQEAQADMLIEAAEQGGFDVLSMPVERTQEAQIEAIRALIAYQADVIAFTPIVESGWDSVLQEAADAAIPLITVGKSLRRTDSGLAPRYVGFDYATLAEQAARTLLQERPPQRGILELYGTLNASDAREIARGCRLAFSRAGLSVTYSVCGDGMRARGYEILSQLQDHLDEIGYIFAHNDAMALGAVDYLREHGLTPGRDVCVCAFGGGDELMALFDAGAVQVVGRLDDAELAARAVSAAKQAIQTPAAGAQATFVSCRVLEGGAAREAG